MENHISQKLNQIRSWMQINKLDAYLKNKVRKKPKAKLSRADIKAMNRGEIPDWF